MWITWNRVIRWKQSDQSTPPKDDPETPEPEPEPEAAITPPDPELPEEPTMTQLADHLRALEAKLDQLIEAGASQAAIDQTEAAIDQTEAAILDTPAATGETLDPATTAAGQESDPARSGGQTENSSPEAEALASGEPATSGRKRKRAFGKRR